MSNRDKIFILLDVFMGEDKILQLLDQLDATGMLFH